MVDSTLKRPLKIMKLSRQNLGGANHCDLKAAIQRYSKEKVF